MDERVAIQRKNAYMLADSLGCSFFPSSGPKRSILGWLVFEKGVAHRLELKVREFDSYQFDSSLIETKLIDRLGSEGLWYAECFSDGYCILYEGLSRIIDSNGLSVIDVEMNSVTVSSKTKKKAKKAIKVPYSYGKRVDMSRKSASNTEIKLF